MKISALVQIGFDTSTGKGANEKHSCWHGIKTSIGMIREEVWYQLAKQLIESKGGMEIHDNLLSFLMSKQRGMAGRIILKTTLKNH